MSKALYRKYRPKTLAEVVGESQVTANLAKSIESGKISHAYIFIGPRGTGKTSVARIFAHTINNFNYELEDDYVDIIEIDGASNRGIDDIRELREKVAIAPTKGKYKVYIIDEVHMLTKEAFNALLKTLEEPPEHAIFIMATTDAHKIPITITSRAQVYHFKLADQATMFNHLRQICQTENISIADEALKIIVKKGGGSFRDSLSLLDQISTLSDQEITKQLVIDSLGLPEDEIIADLLQKFQSQDITAITASLKNLFSSGTKPESINEALITSITTNPKPELLPLLDRLFTVKSPFAEAKLLSAFLYPLIKTPSPSNIPSKIPPLAQPQAQTSSTSTPTSAQPQPAPTTPPQPATPPTPPSPIPTTFNWSSLLQKIQPINSAIHLQLQKTTPQLLGSTLHLYPEKNIVKIILSKPNNLSLMRETFGYKVVVHDLSDQPSSQSAPTTEKDATFNKISAIMGDIKEVNQNNGGEVPF